MSDKRWIYRFKNFEKAFLRLKEAIETPDLNELERNGLVQRFEFTMDMSWKTFRDYMEDEGFLIKPSPKEIFRQAQNHRLIPFAQELIDGLTIRNQLSHDYSGDKFLDSEKKIREDIFPALEKLYQFFNEKV